MIRRSALLIFFVFSTFLQIENARAGGGPLGIDQRWSYDDSGIYKRSIQKNLLTLLVAGDFAGALWEGDQSRLGKTMWQSVDSTILASGSAAVMKAVFTRSRPIQGNDPNQFFQGSGHYSFPSGEVAAMSALVTPFVLEYRQDTPWAYALEALPVYDGVARMKVQAHWQTDVLAGFALGTLSGYYAHSRKKSFTLALLPGGLAIGIKRQF